MHKRNKTTMDGHQEKANRHVLCHCPNSPKPELEPTRHGAMSAERKSIPIKQANMLSVGDAIKIERNCSSDSRMETNVLRIGINGKQLEINVRTGGSGKNMVISLRKGGVWHEKGKTNLRNAYSLYKLV